MKRFTYFLTAFALLALLLVPVAFGADIGGDDHSGDSGLTNLEMWALIVGALTVPVTAYLNRLLGVINPDAKRFSAVIVAALAGVGNAAFAGHLHFDSDLVGSVLVAVVAAITAYHGFPKAKTFANRIDTKPGG